MQQIIKYFPHAATQEQNQESTKMRHSGFLTKKQILRHKTPTCKSKTERNIFMHIQNILFYPKFRDISKVQVRERRFPTSKGVPR